MLASGQVVVRRAAEAGLPIRLVEPQVKAAAGGQQAGGLPDSADGHVALCERGRQGRRSASPATAQPQPQPLRSSRAPSGTTHQSSPPGARSGTARSDTIRSGALGSRCGWCRWLSGTDTGPHRAGSQDPGVWVPLPGGGGGGPDQTQTHESSSQPSPPGRPKVGTPRRLLLGLGSLSPQPLPTLGCRSPGPPPPLRTLEARCGPRYLLGKVTHHSQGSFVGGDLRGLWFDCGRNLQSGAASRGSHVPAPSQDVCVL